MAENSVFSNETGQVMFGSGGNIYKVPYEFGNGFYNDLNRSIYIRVSGLNMPSNMFTLLFWSKVQASTKVFNHRFVSGANQYRHIAYSAGGWHTWGKNITIDGIYAGSILTRLVSNIGDVVLYRIESNKIESSGKMNLNMTGGVVKLENINYDNLSDETFEHLDIGISGTTYYTATENRYVLFTRALSDYEYRYFYNLRNGNSVLSKQGLYLDLRLNFAEILTIGGIDKVGVRDYSGNNRHGEIMNLPAGTLQEQLDWANANLFVPFIS